MTQYIIEEGMHTFCLTSPYFLLYNHLQTYFTEQYSTTHLSSFSKD
jgi:hypothetical protein